MNQRHLIALGAAVLAFAVGAGNAAADPGDGQAQGTSQGASTSQAADSGTWADQNAVNANVPVTVAGGSVTGGSSSANQVATNGASANSSNTSDTSQTANATQIGGSSSCKYGCGGAGQAQAVEQSATTTQTAKSSASADQNAVNANVPVTVAGGSVKGGTSTANQKADNSATASSTNTSTTTQDATATQIGGSSSCYAGCGGAGQAQKVSQTADTSQKAKSEAEANQNAVNANTPVTVAGGHVYGGSSTAKQHVSNSADANSSNNSTTAQAADALQVGSGSKCGYGCGGAGQAQDVSQSASTWQGAFSDADANQKAVNSNSPSTVAGYGTKGGSSAAVQGASNSATASSTNDSVTYQGAIATQIGGGSSCYAGCGGAGQSQHVSQDAWTGQIAGSEAEANQKAINSNHGSGKGSSFASQLAGNSADASSSNSSATIQFADALQLGGGSKCGYGCGGAGQAQKVGQSAGTFQLAFSDADANQKAVNSNSGSGYGKKGGSSAALQGAVNSASASSSNNSLTVQDAIATQIGGGSKCKAGCGGSGRFQGVHQNAWTGQLAISLAFANQKAVNSNSPVAVGWKVKGGSSFAGQLASNSASADSSNSSATIQLADAFQLGGHSKCGYGCGGAGQSQKVSQDADTWQVALSLAHANQKAINSNSPVSIAGYGVGHGSSKAIQFARNRGSASSSNWSLTLQLARASQVRL
jgi:hypothetical protein